MFKKSFVSIFFSSDRLQVLQLNSSKKKVLKYASINLPGGIISNYKVNQKDELAKIIRGIWDKLILKERAVGLILPEFSTFTKLFSLPKLPLEELDEAVRWQAQDFLPEKLSEMIMDWKIVKSQDDGYQILAVAMDREILDGYVDATVAAGLFPFVVETPSLSLVRLSTSKETGRLILYNNFGEGILIISEGEKILGSSIIPMDEKAELLRTASQIIVHYKETKFEKIMTGGVNLDASSIEDLEKELKLPLEWMKPKVTGLTDDQIQEYLVPISLQLNEPTRPSDENTVNLLPSKLVKKYETEKLKLQIWSLILSATLVIWVCFLAAFGTYLYLSQQVSRFTNRTSKEQEILKARTQAITQIKEINQYADRILKIRDSSVSSREIFDAVNSLKPAGIEITDYKLNLEKGEVNLGGNAVDRLSLIEFKRRLEENSKISSVNIPISSFEVENNLEFKVSFFYGTESIKKKGI